MKSFSYFIFQTSFGVNRGCIKSLSAVCSVFNSLLILLGVVKFYYLYHDMPRWPCGYQSKITEEIKRCNIFIRSLIPAGYTMINQDVPCGYHCIRQDNIFIRSLIPGYIKVCQIIQIIPWYTKCSLWVYKTRQDNIFIWVVYQLEPCMGTSTFSK